MNRVLAIAFLLAFAGGYADAVSYLLTGAFTGHLTGNIVLLTIHVAQMQWWQAVSNALAIAAFAVGTAAAGWTAPPAGRPNHARQLRAPLLIESALGVVALGSGLLDSWLGNELGVVCLCLMLGQQNGALRRCGALSVHTTFVTGLSTTLLSTMAERAAGREDPADQPKHHPWTVAALLTVFTAGAFTGAWAEGVWKLWSLAGLFVPLAVSLGLTVGSED